MKRQECHSSESYERAFNSLTFQDYNITETKRSTYVYKRKRKQKTQSDCAVTWNKLLFTSSIGREQ